MKKENKNRNEESDRPASGSNTPFSGKRDVTDNAREEAAGDIEEDADLSIGGPNDDLDEGESARLGEDKNDMI